MASKPRFSTKAWNSGALVDLQHLVGVRLTIGAGMSAGPYIANQATNSKPG